MFIAAGYAFLAVILTAMFFISRRFVTTRLAIRMMLLMTVAFFAVLMLTAVLSGQLEKWGLLDHTVAGVLILAGLGLAILATIATGWIFLRWVRRRTPPVQAETFE